MTTIKIWVALVAVAIIAIIGVFSPSGKALTQLGVNCLSDAVTCFTAVDTEDGYSVDGTAIISGVGNITTTGTARVAEFTQGGGNCTITDANGGAYVLSQAELTGCNVLKITASGAGQEVIQLTLPATSTLTTLLASTGDLRMWIVDATALAAATTTTITAGTGVDVMAYTTNDDVIDGAEIAELTCFRQADTDVTCITTEILHAD